MVLLEGEANIDSLRCQVAEAEQRLDDLRRQLQEAEHLPIGPSNGHYLKSPCSSLDTSSDSPAPFPVSTHPLELEEYTRYGRQMIVPSIGLEGQIMSQVTARVLIRGQAN